MMDNSYVRDIEDIEDQLFVLPFNHRRIFAFRNLSQ